MGVNARRLGEARDAVANGQATVLQLRMARQGGKRKFSSKEEAAAAAKQDANERHQHASAKWYMERRSLPGCSVPGCLLAVCEFTTLLESDHRDDTEKCGNIANLHGFARVEEMKKTDPKCMWHHFEHTRVQRGDVPSSDLPDGFRKDLAQYKERVGCEHPNHNAMPYAGLVRSAIEDKACSWILRGISRLPGYEGDVHKP
jgi:hypothetical protein